MRTFLVDFTTTFLDTRGDKIGCKGTGTGTGTEDLTKVISRKIKYKRFIE